MKKQNVLWRLADVTKKDCSWRQSLADVMKKRSLWRQPMADVMKNGSLWRLADVMKKGSFWHQPLSDVMKKGSLWRQPMAAWYSTSFKPSGLSPCSNAASYFAVDFLLGPNVYKRHWYSCIENVGMKGDYPLAQMPHPILQSISYSGRMFTNGTGILV
jgi:hypothetical protein